MTDTQRHTAFIASVSKPDYSGYEWWITEYRDEMDARKGVRAAWQIDNAPNLTEAMGALLASLAGQYVGESITITQLIPRPATADEKLDAARSALRADYWQDVQNVVANLRFEIEQGNITDTDAAIEWLDQTVDGHQRVIYTGRAIECLLFSPNESAYSDEGIGDTETVDIGLYSKLAYFAFRADILAEIGDIEDFIDTHKPMYCDECADQIPSDDLDYSNELDGLCAACREKAEAE